MSQTGKVVGGGGVRQDGDRVELHGATPCWERYPDAALAPLSSGYKRREPEKTLLYQVVEENLSAFLAEARERSSDGDGLPRFVVREFERYLACGRLEHGFCRVVCSSCGDEKLVAFSCHGRGFCPSCGARRMFDTAAHLLDRVVSFVPCRQGVQSFPRQIRMRLAYEREFFLAARRIVVAAIFAWQRRRARTLGVARPLAGAISFAQRFASSLAISPHLPLLVPDGVFFEGPDGTVLFRALPPPEVKDLESVAARIARRIAHWVERHPVVEEPRDGLAATYASAAEVPRGPTVVGPQKRPAKLEARVEGFSLEADRHVYENDRDGLERLLRYMSRPPLSMDRLSRGSDGQLVIRFKRALSDGSKQVRLSPMELLRRLAALVPRPGFHMISAHGVFAARSKHRAKIVPVPRQADVTIAAETTPPWAIGSAEEPDLFPPFPAPQPREHTPHFAAGPLNAAASRGRAAQRGCISRLRRSTRLPELGRVAAEDTRRRRLAVREVRRKDADHRLRNRSRPGCGDPRAAWACESCARSAQLRRLPFRPPALLPRSRRHGIEAPGGRVRWCRFLAIAKAFTDDSTEGFDVGSDRRASGDYRCPPAKGR